MEAKKIISLFEGAPFKGRHGDVIVVRDDGAKDGAEKCPGKELAFGEVTGHAHRVTKGRAQVLKVANAVAQRLVKVAQAATVDHEEHTAQRLPKGTYRSGVQAQWTPEGLRRVED
jgi:hypothetical protein